MLSNTAPSQVVVPDARLSPDETELARLIVSALNLETPAEDIAPDAPLYGEGLGLDSIDALELVLGLEQEFGVSIDDQQVGSQVLSTVNGIVQFIVEKRTPSATVAG
jgi:acyl carrier protein